VPIVPAPITETRLILLASSDETGEVFFGFRGNHVALSWELISKDRSNLRLSKLLITKAKRKSATKFLQLTDALRTAGRFLAFRFPLPLGLEKFLELENLFAGGLSVSTARQNVIETLRADA
jgi:hypothetical protein